jgi:hypothetical protein
MCPVQLRSFSLHFSTNVCAYVLPHVIFRCILLVMLDEDYTLWSLFLYIIFPILMQLRFDLFIHLLTVYWSRDSSVGIATGYGLDDLGVGVRVTVGSRIFSTTFISTLEPTRPPVQWVTGALCPGVKRRGHEADHSPATIAEVKKMWIYTFTLPIRLDGVVKHMDNFTFYLQYI